MTQPYGIDTSWSTTEAHRVLDFWSFTYVAMLPVGREVWSVSYIKVSKVIGFL